MTPTRTSPTGHAVPRPLTGFLRKAAPSGTEASVPPPSAEESREADRLHALERYDILDTPPEEAFDRITRLTRRIFDVPMAAVTLIDGHRQWLKAFEGPLDREGPREDAFSRHALHDRQPLIVADALVDERFRDNPAVTGAPHIRAYAGVPLINAEGHTIGTLCAIDIKPRDFDAHEVEILSDLAGIAVGELELRRHTARDGLTGVYSRPAFREHGERTVDLALRHHQNLSMLIADVDRFKAINGRLGQSAGDSVLKTLVEVCSRELRKTDLIGRIGGDEFAILLPGANAASALKVAEKLQAAVRAADYDLEPEGETKVTASFGVASLDRASRDLDTLIANAGGALHKARASGGDSSVVWRAQQATDGEARRRVLKAGSIVFNNRNSAVDCTVRSISESGASLEVISSRGVPKQFLLAIRSDKFERPCHVLAMTDKTIEVAFEKG